MKLNTILRNNIEITSISVPPSNEQTAIIENFLRKLAMKCTTSLNNDPVSSAYLEETNKGGLKYPTSSLSNYVSVIFFSS